MVGRFGTSFEWAGGFLSENCGRKRTPSPCTWQLRPDGMPEGYSLTVIRVVDLSFMLKTTNVLAGRAGSLRRRAHHSLRTVDLSWPRWKLWTFCQAPIASITKKPRGFDRPVYRSRGRSGRSLLTSRAGGRRDRIGSSPHQGQSYVSEPASVGPRRRWRALRARCRWCGCWGSSGRTCGSICRCLPRLGAESGR